MDSAQKKEYALGLYKRFYRGMSASGRAALKILQNGDPSSRRKSKANSESDTESLKKKVIASLTPDGKQAMDELINSVMPTLHRRASRESVDAEEAKDMAQDAYFGALSALMRFDPKKDVAFETFAVSWGQGSMRRDRLHRNEMQKSSYAREQGRKLLLEAQAIRVETGEDASDSQLALRTGIDQKAVIALNRGKLHSADALINEDGETFANNLPDESWETPENLTVEGAAMHFVQKILSGMRKDLREVLVMEYGLGGAEQMSRKAAAAKLGMAQSSLHKKLKVAELEFAKLSGGMSPQSILPE